MDDLTSYIQDETNAAVHPNAMLLAKELSQHASVQAVIFYGSGLWKESTDQTIYDFYVLIDSYKSYGSPSLSAFGGALVPPNVYYKQITHNGQMLRCKYAVMTLKQFVSAAKGQSFTPHIWARFAQPCRIVFTHSEDVRQQITKAITQAINVFHKRTLELCAVKKISIKDLWVKGLQMTYSCEIRSESPERTEQIFNAQVERFLKVTSMVLGVDKNSPDQVFDNPKYNSSKLNLMMFYIKRPIMKLVVISRFIKAAFTFSGGMEYAQLKIRKHSGVDFEMTEFQKKHPLIGGWPVFWKVIRAGGLK